ncbi:fluoride efflux transporter FluC [Lihuaxuella thermophila]|uniref:Fluoride-specific ion channel FluC n=1 Tax=Lihuaxuella thermophila TaxID=1173111 RepID=A0A1H8IEE1_9BACL|nr:CrcB family protein [Lihuaxuella thermophila]SEN66427.1 CrcB protein [Lihuaxuella thermophila]
MKQIWYVAVGGFAGTLLRFSVSSLLNGQGFPWGTLLVNWTGCFFLGWLFSFASGSKRFPPEWRTGLGTGLIGSYTTFSTFSAETLRLEGWSLQALYVTASVIGGILLAMLGDVLGKEKGTA